MFSDAVFDAYTDIKESLKDADPASYDKTAVIQMLTSMIYVMGLGDSITPGMTSNIHNLIFR
jgi:hypothetical protein